MAAHDPEMAGRLIPSDRQRLLRALEVVEATGRSLRAWQADPPIRLPLPPLLAGMALVPPAAAVNPRIEARLEAMLEAGALGEIRDLLERVPEATTLPIAKVHGLREFAAVLRDALPVELARASVATKLASTRSGSVPGSATGCRSSRRSRRWVTARWRLRRPAT